MTKKNYTFTIDYDTMKTFKEMCREIDKPFSQVIEQIIEDWIDAQEQMDAKTPS